MSKNSVKQNLKQLLSWRDNELNFGQSKRKQKTENKYLNNYGK